MKKSMFFLAIALTCSTLTACSVTNEDPSLVQRAAKGDITQYAGARRATDLDPIKYNAYLQEAKKLKAKNVILLIGDGMGDSEITAARNFAQGAGGYFKGLDALPFSGQYTHYSLDKNTHKPDYVTDSAASATAWSTGVKTYNGALGVDVYGNEHDSLLDLAKKAGLATGDISTSEIEDATPAALFSSVSSRKCYGPDETSAKCPTQAVENGGQGSIVEQLIANRPDVVMGGGAKTFDQKVKAGKYKGMSLYEVAKSEGYQLVTDNTQLADITVANSKTPLLGLFAQGNMPIRLEGPQAKKGGIESGKVVECKVNAKRGENVPTLATMTQKAISLLSQNEKGFFLQVEGASIDKQAHASNPCGQFGETMDLDEAVQVALDFAKTNKDTLVIVTADHAHATQIVYPDATSFGYTQLVQTKDGAPMGISYGNSKDIDDAGHTGAQLRIAAYGPGSLKVLGLTDQTDLFFTIKSVLSL